MKEPDPQAVAAAQRGDRDAFERLVVAYQPDVWRLAVCLVRDEHLAQDVVQEAFVRVFRFLPRFRGDSKFSTWLYSITRNCAQDALRTAGREARVLRSMRAVSASAEDIPLRVEIREAIAALPRDLMEPLVLVDLFETSYREVADILGIAVGTVKSRVFRARNILMSELQHDTSSEAGP